MTHTIFYQQVVLDEADKLLELDSGLSQKALQEEDEGDDEDVDAGEMEDGSAVIGEKIKGRSSSIKGPNRDARSSFLTQVDEILAECTYENLQRALFSATIGPLVQELAHGFLRNAGN